MDRRRTAEHHRAMDQGRAMDQNDHPVGHFRASERGEGNLGCIVWALVVIIVGYAVWMLVPVKMSSAQFYDAMEEQAKYAQRSNPPRMKKALLNRARELDIPIDPKDLSVERFGDTVRMRARYTIPVDFGAGIVYDWEFNQEVERAIFY